MKINIKIASYILRVVVSAILIFSIFYITYHLWHGWSPSSILFYIIISILITSFSIKSERLTHSVLTGIFIGYLSGLIFFSYFYIDTYNLSLKNTSEYIDWGLVYAFSIMFTIIWIFSCVFGGVISYFIRKFLKEKL